MSTANKGIAGDFLGKSIDEAFEQAAHREAMNSNHKKTKKISREYKGYTVKLSDAVMKFEVDLGGGFTKLYGSYEEVMTAIDRLEQKKEQIGRKRIAVEVWASDGSERTITGAHAANGYLLVTPPKERYSNLTLYPKTDAIKAAIEEVKRLENARANLQEVLYSFRLSDTHEGTVAELEALLEKAKRNAEENPIDLSKIPVRKKLRI